eukprot:TRINITY_DN3623_c0_g1_i3.p1 TRINITY_DN3623_c0_g1~~TRINITY_DN3623_c0_g1_i3.p1  ORF type:complete len:512 (+),score=66.55 TRINITY_DN3623_c0_g1_i3:291-1826(+)
MLYGIPIPQLQSSGAVTIRIANTREPYNFVYYRGNDSLVVSDKIIPVDRDYPTQGHLSVTSNGPSEMLVMWTSGSIRSPIVIISKDEGFTTSHTFRGVSYTYTKEEFIPCDNGDTKAIKMFRPPGTLNYVLLCDLNPSTVYYYRFGTEEVMSEVFSFKSSPVVSRQSSVSVVIYGDMGTSLCLDPAGGWCGLGAACVLDRISKRLDEKPFSYDHLLHIGDLSYAVGRAYRWDMWMNEIQSVSSRVPYMVTLGNHEYDFVGQDFQPKWGNYYNDSGVLSLTQICPFNQPSHHSDTSLFFQDGECGIPTRKRFIMPWDSTADLPPRLGSTTEDMKHIRWWYSYNLGNIHFIVLSMEHNFTTSSEQWKWMVRDMKTVNRSITPWLVVAGHRPLYSSGTSDVGDYHISEHLRQELEIMMLRFQVDLVFTGHYHNYERTCPVYRQVCLKRAPVHILVGTGGIDNEDEWIEPEPEWSVFRASTYGYVTLTTNSTSLSVSWVGCRDGVVHDSYSIHKS